MHTINIRQDRSTGEYLAFIPGSYDAGRGRYYMAYTLLDGWAEVTPEYAVKRTRTAKVFPEALRRATEANLGYLLSISSRLRG